MDLGLCEWSIYAEPFSMVVYGSIIKIIVIIKIYEVKYFI